MTAPKKPRVATHSRKAAVDALLHNVIAFAVVGACGGLLDVLNSGTFTWRSLGVAVATGAVSSVVAYLRAAYITPYLAIRKTLKED